jgi:hypothetical protein
LWAGFVSEYISAAVVSEHVNEASPSTRTRMPVG